MPECEKLERVIEGLEWCMCEKHDCYREKGCPYENEGDGVGCKYALHRDALALLKAQEPETSDAPKPDNNIGCWYDITHNYTLEQVVSALKSRELCEDAVSRKYLLGQSYSISFQTIDESDEEAYREEVVCVEDIEDAPSVQPVPVARVMTLKEVLATEVVYAEDIDKVEIIPVLVSRRAHDCIVLIRAHLMGAPSRVIYPLISEYGKRWRCWTSRPTEAEREAVKWG